MYTYKNVVGIDYSLTSPAISVNNKDFYFLTDNKKVYDACSSIDYLHPSYHKKWMNNEERYDNISEWALSCVPEKSVIYIEGYSMGSKGKVFNIAENTGLLKWKLRQKGYPIKIVEPTTLKKYTTGKGNANKEKMNEAFEEKMKWNLKQILCQSAKNWNPSSDIIDAFFLTKYGYEELINLTALYNVETKERMIYNL